MKFGMTTSTAVHLREEERLEVTGRINGSGKHRYGVIHIAAGHGLPDLDIFVESAGQAQQIREAASHIEETWQK